MPCSARDTRPSCVGGGGGGSDSDDDDDDDDDDGGGGGRMGSYVDSRGGTGLEADAGTIL